MRKGVKIIWYIISMEEWRVINNFPNYCVSNLGNVKNNNTNKLMKMCLKGGYYNVSLVNETGQKTFTPLKI